MWDVIDDVAAVKIVASEVAKRSLVASPDETSQVGLKSLAQGAADALVKRARVLGSLDNMTALVALFVWE